MPLPERVTLCGLPAASSVMVNAAVRAPVADGVNVTPDIVVENDAKSVLAGKDPQLERGIAEVLQRMNANPKKLPARPADPVKTPK